MTKVLTLDMDIGQYDEAATRQQLAALYNIDESLISLVVVGGSVQLTLSIATSSGNGVGPEVPLDDILARVSSVSDEALSAALGVGVTSVAPQLISPPSPQWALLVPLGCVYSLVVLAVGAALGNWRAQRAAKQPSRLRSSDSLEPVSAPERVTQTHDMDGKAPSKEEVPAPEEGSDNLVA